MRNYTILPILEIKSKAAQKSVRTADIQLLLQLHELLESGCRSLLWVSFDAFCTISFRPLPFSITTCSLEQLY